MRIRAALPEDAAAIAEIEAVAASRPWSLPSVASALALPTTAAFVACTPAIEGHLLATAVVDEGEVLTVAVRPEARRRGIGRALMGACADHWRERGVARAFLEVRADNAGAIALYRALGWRDAGVRPRYYADGTDALQLALELG